ncbi:MAG: hypothetical protein ABIB47_00530 [Candidatus Woesearchaeota archaeon]
MDEIFKISKDKERTKSLQEMAKERIEKIIPVLPKELPYKIIEEYYEVIVQLITAIMYANGFKTLSHVSLIDYLAKNYKGFESNEIRIVDTLRRVRHGTVYYGKKAEKEFLINNESAIKEIIEKLFLIIKKTDSTKT